MNAIIALCHFCEVHGPRIVFCTQPFRQQEPTTEIESDDASLSSYRRVKSNSVSSNSSCDTPSCATPSLPSMKNDLCEGCYSIKTGYYSQDDDAQVSYVSRQQPHHPRVFSRIRQACIRSLSCEVCPGKEGPIFFGDEQYGHVLSYTFFLADSQARGIRRWNSILVVMMDKIYLLNSWPFLVPHLKTVIDNLQSKADRVFEMDEKTNPQRLHRLTSSRRGGKPARSLVELTGYNHVFKLLHLSFVWILKSCSNRISETLLEGPPTEDSIIDMEKQEETEDGFIKVYTRKLGDGDTQHLSGDESDSSIDMGVGDVSVPGIKNIRHLWKVLGHNQFHTLAHHAVIGNQIIVTGSPKSLVKSILIALKCLLPKGCCRTICYSSKYEESWRCNFLGLKPGIMVPKHVMSSEMFVLVEVKTLGMTDSDQIDNSLNSLDSEKGEINDLLSTYTFKMSSPVVLPAKAPIVLKKMKLAIQNENLTEEVVESCFVCLKEEWMNKVKVLFKFTKAGGSRSKEDTAKLLQVVGARDEDQQLLKFWMTGLSVQYRTHILSSSMSQVS
ncbi:folliculin-like [Gigantopelta aegis]|uniref:folliculin-like n=1 Tax=Gigantopelta aegis TaxID=1735272 RepID=UPI001B888D6B|nr:folliculin-like [Gigantopelta aegis]